MIQGRKSAFLQTQKQPFWEANAAPGMTSSSSQPFLPPWIHNPTQAGHAPGHHTGAISSYLIFSGSKLTIQKGLTSSTGKQITLLCLGLREAERSRENSVEGMSWRRGKHPTAAVSEKAVSPSATHLLRLRPAHLLRLRPAAPTLQCEASHLSRTRPSHPKTHDSKILTLPHQLLSLVFSRRFL